MFPSSELVLNLSPESRAALYAALSHFEQNGLIAAPFRRSAAFGPWSQAPGLSAEARTLLDALSYRQRDEYVLADLAPFCRRLTRDADLLRVFEVLLPSSGVQATVRSGPNADVEAIARYWQHGRNGVDLHPHLGDAEALGVDLAELLPGFARRRVNSYQPLGELPRNCYWTAAHFLDDAEPDPNGAVFDEPEMQALLAASYVRVSLEDRRLGDVIAIHAGSELIHVANHVAGNLVFTKNGATPLRPWILSRFSDLLAAYPTRTEVSVFRLRSLTGPS